MLTNSGQSSRLIRFGVFEVDLETGELRKRGVRIRVPEQAFRVLAMLLERPGELTTRAKLQERLWPGGVHLDFEHGLNKAMNRLRTALGDSASSPRLIETVAKRGYRLLVPVSPTQGAPRSRIHLAVLPFENLSMDAEQDFISDGFTEEMISELGQLSPAHLGIIARSSAMQYKHSRKRVDQIGRELNVEYVLEGTVRRFENRARITAQLLQVSDQTQLWAQSYDRELADILQVQREVAQRVADSLAFKLLPERHGKVVNPAAYEAYLRGRYLWSKGNAEDAFKAIACFQRSLELDPHYPLAYSGIADCYGRLVWFSAMRPAEAGPKSMAAAECALEQDANLGEAHASMALVRFWYQWDWMEAEKELRRATELRPNYADAHNLYAAYLNVVGRFDEAAAEQKLAEELDPLSLTIAMNAADPYYFDRQYAPAIRHLLRVLEREPRFFPASFNLGRAYAQNGMFPQAIHAFEDAARLSGSPQVSAPLAYAYAKAGRGAEARNIQNEMEQLAAAQYVPSPTLALIHLGLGEYERALDLLERGFEERSYWLIYLKVDPVYDEIRSHPRFQALLQRLNFGGRAAAH